MASIRQRGKDSWTVIFQTGEGTPRQQIWESGYTKSEAKARKAQIEFEEARGIKIHAINEEHYGNSNKTKTIAQEKKKSIEHTSIDNQSIGKIKNSDNSPLLKPFMEEFIRIYGAKKWGESHYYSTISLLENYVYGYWKNIPISEFTVRAIDEYYTWLVTECKGASSNGLVTPNTANDIHKTMRCAFNKAVQWQYIESNPFLKATVPEHKSKIRPALTPSEIEKVLDYTDSPNDYDLFLIHCAINLAFAGSMRGGEIGALQWSDIVDPQRRIIYICKSINRVNKEALAKVSKTEIYYTFPSYNPRTKTIIVLKNTKEDSGSDRNAYLPAAVYDKLMHLRKMQEKVKEEYGNDCYFDHGMIICQENGKPIMTEHLNKRFQKVLNEIGIKPKRGNEQYVFHSIRSTATTYKLRISGGDIKAVQGENGQKDATMVTHQYSRILDEDRSRISDIMEEQFYGKKDNVADKELMQTVMDNPELLTQFKLFVEMMNSASKT